MTKHRRSRHRHTTPTLPSRDHKRTYTKSKDPNREDPAVWAVAWSGEIVWPTTDARIYEYACHEGNYSFANILRGARLLEAEALAAKKK